MCSDAMPTKMENGIDKQSSNFNWHVTKLDSGWVNDWVAQSPITNLQDPDDSGPIRSQIQ